VFFFDPFEGGLCSRLPPFLKLVLFLVHLNLKHGRVGEARYCNLEIG
jgi:hypothetical protein